LNGYAKTRVTLQHSLDQLFRLRAMGARISVEGNRTVPFCPTIKMYGIK